MQQTKLIALASAAAMAIAAGPLAAAPMSSSQMLASFTPNDLMAIAQSIGYTAEPLSTDSPISGQSPSFVGITASNGAKFFAMPMACNSAGKCIGLSLEAIYSGGGYPLSTANDFNNAHVFTQAYITSDGAAHLSRYEIADSGIPVGNVVVNYQTFAGLIPQFSATLSSTGAGASLTTPAKPGGPAGASAFGESTAAPMSARVGLPKTAAAYANKPSQ